MSVHQYTVEELEHDDGVDWFLTRTDARGRQLVLEVDVVDGLMVLRSEDIEGFEHLLDAFGFVVGRPPLPEALDG